MSGLTHVYFDTFDVDPSTLPPPATRLVITQCWATRENPRFWAWMIDGTFYDREGNIIWNQKVFIAYYEHPELDAGGSESDDDDAPDDEDSDPDVNSAYDDEDSDSESGSESGRPPIC